MEEKKYRGFVERQFYKLVLRESWTSKDLPQEAVPLQTPLKAIVLSYTETNSCKSREECAERVKEVQELSRKQGMPDTQFNFLVGGDEHIYEALGWHHCLPDCIQVLRGGEKLLGQSIEVAFIGKHSNDPTDAMQRGLGHIITMGLSERLLVEDFVVYCRNEDSIDFIEGRDQRRERKRYIEERRREKRDPNFKKPKKERLYVDVEAWKKELDEQRKRFPNK